MRHLARIFRHALFFLAAGLIAGLAGCAPGATVVPPTPTVTIAAPTETSTSLPTETPLPTDTPVPTTTTFVPKATIGIASESPLSGQWKTFGTAIMDGARLAVQQLAGPINGLGYQIEFTPYNDQNDLKAALDTARTIVADPRVLCVVGPFSSRVLSQVQEVYHQAGLAFVSPSATAAYATHRGYPEVNRLLGRHDIQGVAAARFAKEQGFSRVFIISQSTDYAKFNANHFSEEAGRSGIQLVGNVTTDAVKNFGGLIDSVLQAKADLVYFSTQNVEQAGRFFRDAHNKGYEGGFMGIQDLDNPALAGFVGAITLAGRGIYYTVMAAPAASYPEAAGFVEDFRTRWGMPPPTFTAQAYDAAGICMKAIEEASLANGGDIPSRAEVAKAIRALKDYQGITGTFNLDENGDPNPAQYFVFKVVAGSANEWSLNSLVASYDVAPP